MYLERHTELFTAELDVLHFAPEAGIARRLRDNPRLAYRTADLAHGADLTLDLQDLALPSDSVDVILCCHVLEHVRDDTAAMREISRVLRPTGWAILQVPIQGLVTIEDPWEEDPRQRAARFGQADHFRQYGRDYEQRLRDAGLEPEVIDYRQHLEAGDYGRYGLRYDLRREYGVDFDAIVEPWEIWRVTPARS